MTIKVLFVCLGNICRSPLAQGVFEHEINKRGLSDKFIVDSAGTSQWHIGEPPDPRSISVASTHGISIGDQRCRQLVPEDFETYDYIFGMDKRNMVAIADVAPGDHGATIAMILEFAGNGKIAIPDPYSGGKDAFEAVFETLETASRTITDLLMDQASRS